MFMAEKKLNENGAEIIDGRQVEDYAGKFKNTFSMDFDEGALLSDGRYVTMVVTARVEVPKFVGIKSGGLKRIHQMVVEDVRCLDNDEAKFIFDQMGKLPNSINPEIAEVSHLSVVSNELSLNLEDLEVE